MAEETAELNKTISQVQIDLLERINEVNLAGVKETTELKHKLAGVSSLISIAVSVFISSISEWVKKTLFHS